MPPEVDDFGVENEEIVQTQLYALALDDDKLENSGFSNTFKDLPLQHVNLFLPFFISDLSVNDVDFFKESLKPELFEKFKECFLYPDKDQKIMTLFNFFVKSLRKSKFARAFANWIQKFGKDEEMKQLFWMDMVDRGAFAVYKYHILGIGNEYNPGDNVDKIAS
uniref:Uncharacterized protein n=1 Tax=Panagrolaimus sp. JU765 TaxID=591449 RepID=A0AC34QV86_9BILA